MNKILLISKPVLHERTLFPYTTLFRSIVLHCDANAIGLACGHRCGYGLGDEGTRMLRRFRFTSECRMGKSGGERSEEHTSELQSRFDIVCRLLLEKKT